MTAQLSRLDAEERAAWNEYVAWCTEAGSRYDEVEPWAWAKLTMKLAGITTRRQALTERAAA